MPTLPWSSALLLGDMAISNSTISAEKPVKLWRELNYYERVDLLKELSKTCTKREVTKLLSCSESGIEAFCYKYNLVGLWKRGAREGNSNARVHGNGKNTIRRLTRRIIVASGRDLHICQRCGWEDKTEELPRHHIDRDRENNTIGNLEVLCKTCHAIEHMKERSRDLYGRVL